MTEQQTKAVEEAVKRRTIPPLSRAGFKAGAKEVINNPEKYGLVDINKIDFYAGELNKERISAWRAESKAWNIESSSLANIFCKGIDFVMEALKGGAECKP